MLLSGQQGLCFANKLSNMHTIAKPCFARIRILPATALNLWGFVYDEAIALQDQGKFSQKPAQVACHLGWAWSIHIANVFIAED